MLCNIDILITGLSTSLTVPIYMLEENKSIPNLLPENINSMIIFIISLVSNTLLSLATMIASVMKLTCKLKRQNIQANGQTFIHGAKYSFTPIKLVVFFSNLSCFIYSYSNVCELQ